MIAAMIVPCNNETVCPCVDDGCVQTGRVDSDTPRVCGHAAALTDIKWNPFDDRVIASCSEDTKVGRSVVAIRTASYDLGLSLQYIYDRVATI